MDSTLDTLVAESASSSLPIRRALAVLLVATVLSVSKPRGMTRHGRRQLQLSKQLPFDGQLAPPS